MLIIHQCVRCMLRLLLHTSPLQQPATCDVLFILLMHACLFTVDKCNFTYFDNIMSPVQDPEGKYEALSKYARDLTAAARDGKLDPVIGRDDEIRRAIQILSRRTKNNPVLIGEPGVGKTAVAEGVLHQF